MQQRSVAQSMPALFVRMYSALGSRRRAQPACKGRERDSRRACGVGGATVALSCVKAVDLQKWEIIGEA